MTLRSALYVGTVSHRRPHGPTSAFVYHVAMPLLYLDELPELSRLHPLAAMDPDEQGLPRPIRLRRTDFLAPTTVPLDAAVHAALSKATPGAGAGAGAGDPTGAVTCGPDEPTANGPIAMLAHLRTWGWLFNPITLYYCFDSAGDSVHHVVLEVTNTPWHERTAYVVGPPGAQRLEKSMHVSPFLPMDLDYRVRYDQPGASLRFAIDVVERESGQLRLATGLHLRRRPLDRGAVRRLLRGDTARVSAGIYHQAAKLLGRNARFHRHPARD